jgi:hypothetical protein
MVIIGTCRSLIGISRRFLRWTVMSNHTFRHRQWISWLGDLFSAFQLPALTGSIKARLLPITEKARSRSQRVNWRSPILLGFALSLIYWIGLYGWIVADVNFKAFRYAGF